MWSVMANKRSYIAWGGGAESIVWVKKKYPETRKIFFYQWLVNKVSVG